MSKHFDYRTTQSSTDQLVGTHMFLQLFLPPKVLSTVPTDEGALRLVNSSMFGEVRRLRKRLATFCTGKGLLSGVIASMHDYTFG